jgi:hypothetical protein
MVLCYLVTYLGFIGTGRRNILQDFSPGLLESFVLVTFRFSGIYGLHSASNAISFGETTRFLRGEPLQSSIGKFEAERAELDAILSSGMFGRTNNLVRLLTYVCEKHFEGATADIKEYNIAVQALGRPADFDPQVDTIVRVTAHALRKRLDDYYRHEGAEHTVRIALPPGGYVPKFTRSSEIELDRLRIKPPLPNATPLPTGLSLNTRPAHLELPLKSPIPGGTGAPATANPDHPAKNRLLPLLAVLTVALCTVGILAWHWRDRVLPKSFFGHQEIASAHIDASGKTLRALVGNRSPYIDRAGYSWDSDKYCSGGEPFAVSGHIIQGAEDPELFSAGRRGVFQCNYPVPPGTYEVHLLFAETSGFQENSRSGQFSINGGPTINFDAVDDAAGGDIATAKVYTDIFPDPDGTIRVNFSTQESFANAVEILPGTPHKMLPVRIVVGNSSYKDSKGNLWTRDRYYFGGRLSSFAGDLSSIPDGRLYEWHRFGHIHYIIPVANNEKYTLRLYFLERWFGIRNGGVGGAGSRVFDVSCNGAMLLKNFDIFREAGNAPLMKSFSHIEPTAQGKIELYFTPGVNYPSISAIEIVPE